MSDSVSSAPTAGELKHPLAELGRAALAFAGAADLVDGSPEMQQLNAAISAYSLNRTGVDWPLVERLGRVLAARRRDLKLYSYLALAIFCNASAGAESPYSGLGALLAACADLVEYGWERCLPSTPSRRQGQLKWLSEELASTVKLRPPRPAEAASFVACAAAADRLGELVGKALGLDYPLLHELREVLSAQRPALDSLLAAQRPPAPNPTPPIAPSATPQPSAAPPPLAAPEPTAPPPFPDAATTPVATPAEPAAATSAKNAVDLAPLPRSALEDQLGRIVLLLASQLRAESPHDPAPYWMLRALRWASHDLLRPERVQEVIGNQYKTLLPLPQGYKNLSRQLPARLRAGDYAAVITECEELFGAYPMWLDLQRWVATGLDGLGGQTARAVVGSQVALLLTQCPPLTRFRFGDREGTPFADADTLTWLAAERTRAGVATHVGAAAAARVESAHESIPEGLVPGAAFLQQQLSHCAAGHRRFELQIRLAELLLSHERSDVAWPIVELLLAAITTYRLAEWQPELCVRALRVSIKVGAAAAVGDPKQAELWQKLCHLNASQALEAEPPKNSITHS